MLPGMHCNGFSFVYSFNRRWTLISFLCDCSLVSCFTTPKFTAKPLFRNSCSKQNIFSFAIVLNNPRFTINLDHLARLPISSLYLLKKLFFELHNLLAHLPQLSLLFQKPFRSNFLPMSSRWFNPMIRHGRVWEAKWGEKSLPKRVDKTLGITGSAASCLDELLKLFEAMVKPFKAC